MRRDLRLLCAAMKKSTCQRQRACTERLSRADGRTAMERLSRSLLSRHSFIIWRDMSRMRVRAHSPLLASCEHSPREDETHILSTAQHDQYVKGNGIAISGQTFHFIFPHSIFGKGSGLQLPIDQTPLHALRLASCSRRARQAL